MHYHSSCTLRVVALLWGIVVPIARADTITVCWDGSGDYLLTLEWISKSLTVRVSHV